MKLFSTSLMFLFFTSSLTAQKIAAKESGEMLGSENYSALAVMVYETDENTVEKEWKSLMKKHDAKVSESHGVIMAENVVMEEISSSPVSVYAKVKKAESGTKLLVAISGGDSEAMKRIMENFSRKLVKESVAMQQKEAEKELAKTERELEALQRDNSDLHNDIDRYKEKIRDAENNIQKNLKTQEEARKAVEAQRKAVEAVKEKLNGVF